MLLNNSVRVGHATLVVRDALLSRRQETPEPGLCIPVDLLESAILHKAGYAYTSYDQISHSTTSSSNSPGEMSTGIPGFQGDSGLTSTPASYVRPTLG